MSHFEKVSIEQFRKDCIKNNIREDIIENCYNNIKLPERGSCGSAGYDFYSPFTLHFKGKKIHDDTFGHYNEIKYNYVNIPTGIRWVSDNPSTFLMIVPRSGQGFKNGLSLANTTGIIDSDYYQSDNEGHIMAKITVESPLNIESGKGFMQGIIMEYLTVDNDSCSTIRNGGFGSTDGGR